MIKKLFLLQNLNHLFMNVAKTQTWKFCGVPYAHTKIPQIIVNFDNTFVKIV